jgi:branched-chain amino acid transport system substrate-binding protein
VFKAIRDAGLDIPVATTDGNMTYAQMTQYEAFLPKTLFIPSPEWPKSQRPNQPPEVVVAKETFFKAFEGTEIKPDGPHDYLLALKGFAGINGVYDFPAVPNRGLSESNVVVTRWDGGAKTWVVVSDPLGIPRD